MKVITADCILSRKGDEVSLLVRGMSEIKNNLADTFLKKEGSIVLEAQFSKGDIYKKDKLYGYIFGYLGPKSLPAFQNLGWEIHHKAEAVNLLKHVCGFVKVIVNPKTGESIGEQVRSFAGDTPRDDVHRFVDDAMRFCARDLGLEIISPGEYRKGKEWQG